MKRLEAQLAAAQAALDTSEKERLKLAAAIPHLRAIDAQQNLRHHQNASKPCAECDRLKAALADAQADAFENKLAHDEQMRRVVDEAQDARMALLNHERRVVAILDEAQLAEREARARRSVVAVSKAKPPHARRGAQDAPPPDPRQAALEEGLKSAQRRADVVAARLKRALVQRECEANGRHAAEQAGAAAREACERMEIRLATAQAEAEEARTGGAKLRDELERTRGSLQEWRETAGSDRSDFVAALRELDNEREGRARLASAVTELNAKLVEQARELVERRALCARLESLALRRGGGVSR